MRHAAITFADDVNRRRRGGEDWDLIFCSDMLNLAEFLGLAGSSVRCLPTIAYFHENQLTYPVRCEKERDMHFPMTNITSCLAATEVWFNSDYHRRSFFQAIPNFLKRMPDFQPLDAVDRINDKSCIIPQGINPIRRNAVRRPGPPRILWVARWEHDKNPDDLFAALKHLKQAGHEFRLNVIGEQFSEIPAVFEWARSYFAEEIERWGYQPSREEYEQALIDSDLVVSTANHEFFGVSVVEAISAGAYPVLPHRLSYPELLGSQDDGAHARFFYDGTTNDLSERLAELVSQQAAGVLWGEGGKNLERSISRFYWDRMLPALDDNLLRLATGRGSDRRRH